MAVLSMLLIEKKYAELQLKRLLYFTHLK